MKLYLHTVPLDSGPVIFLNSLDDSIFDVAANFRLTPQKELAISVASLKTGFEPL